MCTPIKTTTTDAGRGIEPRGTDSFITMKELSIKDSGLKTSKMELAKSIGLMEPTSEAISAKEIKNQANSNGQIILAMKVSSQTINSKEKASLFGKTERSIKAIGKVI